LGWPESSTTTVTSDEEDERGAVVSERPPLDSLRRLEKSTARPGVFPIDGERSEAGSVRVLIWEKLEQKEGNGVLLRLL
jgi:hypothetical protein